MRNVQRRSSRHRSNNANVNNPSLRNIRIDKLLDTRQSYYSTANSLTKNTHKENAALQKHYTADNQHHHNPETHKYLIKNLVESRTLLGYQFPPYSKAPISKLWAKQFPEKLQIPSVSRHMLCNQGSLTSAHWIQYGRMALKGRNWKFIAFIFKGKKK